MSAWKVRHEGSPRSIDGLTLQQIVDGLQDGRWEATDEVMGPNDAAWIAIENHPQLAEIAADLEPPPPRVYDDETRLDMNALIDVTLVLLIFFILTTTYSLLQKRLDAPNAADEKMVDLPAVTKEMVQQQMILIQVQLKDGKPVILLEDKPVPPERLELELTAATKAAHKNQIMLLHDDEVPESAVVKVLDAARGAEIDKISLGVPRKK
jgi:biopolymer transport protein ExbD